MVRQNLNPILIDNNPTLEVVVSFKALGDSFQHGVIVMNAPGNRVVFRLTARERDFNELYRGFRSSISSWEWRPAANVPNDHAN